MTLEVNHYIDYHCYLYNPELDEERFELQHLWIEFIFKSDMDDILEFEMFITKCIIEISKKIYNKFIIYKNDVISDDETFIELVDGVRLKKEDVLITEELMAFTSQYADWFYFQIKHYFLEKDDFDEDDYEILKDIQKRTSYNKLKYKVEVYNEDSGSGASISYPFGEGF